MLYLPYGPYDGTAASGTSGQSKGEIKGRGERDRDRERGNNKKSWICLKWFDIDKKVGKQVSMKKVDSWSD